MGTDFYAQLVLGFELQPAELVMRIPKPGVCPKGHPQSDDKPYCALCGGKFNKQVDVAPSAMLLRFAQARDISDPIRVYKDWMSRADEVGIHRADPVQCSEDDRKSDGKTHVLGFFLGSIGQYDTKNEFGMNEFGMEETQEKTATLQCLAKDLGIPERPVKLYLCLYASC